MENAHFPYTPYFYERTCRGSLRSTLWVFGSIIHLVSDSKHHSCWNFCGPKIRVSQLPPTVVQNIFQSFLSQPLIEIVTPSRICTLPVSPFENSEPREDALLLLHTPSVISPWCPSLLALSVGKTFPIPKAATSQIQKQNKVTLCGFTDWISKNQAWAIGRLTFQNFPESFNFNWKYESLTPPRRIEWSWTEPQSSMAKWVAWRKSPRFRDLLDF